ncbi:MAG: N-acetylmuramidase [Gammaproteobacteria bacterium]|nr:N-acetylmuramidase [Gammaproteobacteria bacterium]MDH5732144.1 N-acetylmuramidase [Gammaproteobacteria bacterium]
MTVEVDKLIDDVLQVEGGYVNHPFDRGGPTNYGITQATLSRFLGRAVTAEEVKAMDIETARDIYELKYYRAPRIDKLPTAIQPFVFDCAVNHGPRRAIKFVQEVCNDAGLGPIVADGLMGPKTKMVAEACYERLGEWMLVALVEERQMFYINIVTNDSSQIAFLKGWTNRARKFLPNVA